MKLGTITGIIALCLMVVSVGWGGRLFAQHLEDFQFVEAEVLCTRCLRDCKQTCIENSIPEADCKCSRCYKLYCGGTG